MIYLTKLTKLFMVNAFFILFSVAAIANTTPNTYPIIGYWQTIDGKTKKPSSIIEMQRVGNIFEGKIFRTFSTPVDGKVDVCDLCKGEEKNKPLLGLIIVKNMQCTPLSCKGGTILDPRDGNVYHATIKVINNGQKLKVRGYIGTPLFGKTVIWGRVLKSLKQGA